MTFYWQTRRFRDL